ncbi:MAG: hypothetical protein AMDU4_FER2C00177G0001 [Ferroplasma sp. Type II]|nr:MAG: hypothetical protein AMDU4_FER2C00177G0001 [Ferroplasma sp. Type II]
MIIKSLSFDEIMGSINPVISSTMADDKTISTDLLSPKKYFRALVFESDLISPFIIKLNKLINSF